MKYIDEEYADFEVDIFSYNILDSNRVTRYIRN